MICSSNCHHLRILLFGLHALFIIFALLAGRCAGDAAVDCLPQDRSSLLHLKTGLSFQNSSTLVSWKNGSSCCDWEGVTCDPRYGHVVGLDLSSRGISGNLSASLFNLTSLQTLNLADNNFDGSFPQIGFEELTELMHLNLSHSGLSGQIPIGISRLTRLISLDLMVGSQYISQDREVEVKLQNPNLQMLVHNLSNLRELHLDYVNMSSDLDWSRTLSTTMPQLQVVSLRHCDLTGILPKDILTFKNWMTMDFSGNSRLSGVLPDFPMKNALKVLRLSGTNLSGSLPSSIANLTQIVIIELSSNSLTGSIPSDLFSLPTLEVLYLYHNQFSGQLGEISNPSPSLRHLDLRENRFYGPIAPTESHCGNCTFSKLQVLDISSNYFNGSLLSKCFSMLTVLRNSGLNYSTMGLTTSGNYSAESGEFYFEVTQNGYLFAYKAISSFDLPLSIYTFYYSTQQYYQAPVSVTNKGTESTLTTLLSIFMSLDLSNNAFEGEIPDVIGELQGLQALNLSLNSLTGKIPAAIGNIKQLESLDLSGNHLSGEIPQEMTSLTFLSWLNLSDNNLVGRIPQNNQFSTFPNTSFEGNQGFCGRPSSKQCTDARPNKTVTASPSEPDSSRSTYVIGLGLFVGLGFGAGMAAVLVLQNVSWKFLKRQDAASN